MINTWIKKIVTTWEKIPVGWREEMKSGTHTVLAVALLELAIQMENYGTMMFTQKTAAIAVGIAILRALQKAGVRIIRNKLATSGQK